MILNRLLLIVLLSLALSSCDVILDQVLDCIDNDHPEFSPSDLPVAILNQEYASTITASIKREPNDSSYHYTISFSGNLPSGLTVYQNFNDRTISFEGTPTELGTFRFTLNVHVRDSIYNDYDDDSDEHYYDDGDDLCNDRLEQDFVITVQVMEDE